MTTAHFSLTPTLRSAVGPDDFGSNAAVCVIEFLTWRVQILDLCTTPLVVVAFSSDHKMPAVADIVRCKLPCPTSQLSAIVASRLPNRTLCP
jgi:hypothetical protein